MRHWTIVTYTVTLRKTCVLNRCMHIAFSAYINSREMSKTGDTFEVNCMSTKPESIFLCDIGQIWHTVSII